MLLLLWMKLMQLTGSQLILSGHILFAPFCVSSFTKLLFNNILAIALFCIVPYPSINSIIEKNQNYVKIIETALDGVSAD